jgi:hypothetical protein
MRAAFRHLPIVLLAALAAPAPAQPVPTTIEVVKPDGSRVRYSSVDAVERYVRQQARLPAGMDIVVRRFEEGTHRGWLIVGGPAAELRRTAAARPTLARPLAPRRDAATLAAARQRATDGLAAARAAGSTLRADELQALAADFNAAGAADDAAVSASAVELMRELGRLGRP